LFAVITATSMTIWQAKVRLGTKTLPLANTKLMSPTAHGHTCRHRAIRSLPDLLRYQPRPLAPA
jgi:hypothetical protein